MSGSRLSYVDAAKLSKTLIDAIAALNGAGLKWGVLASFMGANLKVLRAAGMATTPGKASTWIKLRSLPQLWAMPGGQLELTLGAALYWIGRGPTDPLYDAFGLVRPIPLARAWRALRDVQCVGTIQIEHLTLGVQALEAGEFTLDTCKTCHNPMLVMSADLLDRSDHLDFSDGCVVCKLREEMIAARSMTVRKRRPRHRKATIKPKELEGENVAADADAQIADMFHRIGVGVG